MSIYMKNLSSGEEIALDSDTVYETFSVIKLAIASELMHQVQAGKLSLSDRIPLSCRQRTPSLGRALRHGPRTDSDASRLAYPDDHHQRQRGHRCTWRQGWPRQRDCLHAQPRLGKNVDPVFRSRLGPDLAEYTRSLVSQCHRRSDRQLSI